MRSLAPCRCARRGRPHDVAAHLVGTPAELAAGNFPTGDVGGWLQSIVDARHDADIQSLVDEWHALDGTIEPMMQGPGALMFGDVAVHEHDLRATLDRPDHEAMEVDTLVTFALESMAAPARDAGLGAIVVEHDGSTWRSHDEDPGWTLCVEPWEAVRALYSRRTVEELRGVAGRRRRRALRHSDRGPPSRSPSSRSASEIRGTRRS